MFSSEYSRGSCIYCGKGLSYLVFLWLAGYVTRKLGVLRSPLPACFVNIRIISRFRNNICAFTGCTGEQTPVSVGTRKRCRFIAIGYPIWARTAAGANFSKFLSTSLIRCPKLTEVLVMKSPMMYSLHRVFVKESHRIQGLLQLVE